MQSIVLDLSLQRTASLEQYYSEETWRRKGRFGPFTKIGVSRLEIKTNRQTDRQKNQNKTHTQKKTKPKKTRAKMYKKSRKFREFFFSPVEKSALQFSRV